VQVFSYLVGALTLLLVTAEARAQFPGELRGTVVDVLSGRPVPAADVRVQGGAHAVATDAAGFFRLRGLEAGTHVIRVEAPGFSALEERLVVRNGVSTSVRLELTPEIVELEGLTAEVGGAAPGTRMLSGAEIRAVPARTAGELAGRLPGVRIESRGRGAAEVPSIRGSGGDAVLVLVDGVPINDPVTGEADLSTIPASSVSAVRVLPGGRSARFGARAEGGVILVETGRAEGSGANLEAGVGSLGERTLDASGASEGGWGTLSFGAGLRRLDGRFEFDAPEAVGGGRGMRDNAGVSGAHVRAEWSGAPDIGRARFGVAADGMARGLPGRAFAPSRTAEQELRRGRLFSSLDRTNQGPWGLHVSAYGVLQRVEHQDSMPPFGDPFDDETKLRGGGGELRASYVSSRGLRVVAGTDVKVLSVASTQLETSGSMRRIDTGTWLTVAGGGPGGIALSGSVRVDRSGLPSAWHASHEVGAGRSVGPGFALRAAHRSSFSPPTLGDQFFREGVGVQPNPDLHAERVPSEWVASLEWNRDVGGVLAAVEVEAYRGDIGGMILWLPDFRFVWSPRNRDVKRRGVELAAQLQDVGTHWALRTHAAWNRTTYDRPGLEDAQVVYRPEFAGGAMLSWSGEGWRASLSNEFVGARYPVPNRVNRLPAFWATDASVRHRWSTGWGPLEIGVAVDRIFDNDDNLIFAYPDPGRTLRLSARLGG
jgi:vitamin B12 transporter